MPERDLATRAREQRIGLVTVIERGRGGQEAWMDLSSAAWNFRLPESTLTRLGQRQQELSIRIAPIKDQKTGESGWAVVVKLLPRPAQRKDVYRYLAALVQAEGSGKADIVMAMPGVRQALVSEFPDLESMLAVLENSKSTLGDEDIFFLRTFAAAYYESLGNDNSDLPHWQNVFGAAAGS